MLGSSGWHLVVDNPGFNQFHLCRLSRFFRWHHFLHLGYPIYTHHMISWVLLIVEISTAKPKSCIILPNSREKELLNDYFHSRTLFKNSRTLPNGFERFLNTFFHSRTSEVSRTTKTTPVFFFHTNPQNRSFLGLELKNPVLGSSRYHLWPGRIRVRFPKISRWIHWTNMTHSDQLQMLIGDVQRLNHMKYPINIIMKSLRHIIARSIFMCSYWHCIIPVNNNSWNI